MAFYKLKIAEYFDVLINKLDVAVETSTYKNCNDQELIYGLNRQRDAFLAEINQVQEFDLRALSEKVIKPDQEVSDEDLFAKFCFFIKYDQSKSKETIEIDQQVAKEIGLRLIVTDKYLTRRQIEFYEKVFDSILPIDKSTERKEQACKAFGDILFERVKFYFFKEISK